jgi:hypothetical protein
MTMANTTPNLALPYILPSQAQKHVTHNEALQRLDAITNTTISGQQTEPPAAPAEGEIWLVAPAATGHWSGKDGLLAEFMDATWSFLTPKKGWTAWFASDKQVRIYDGAAWVNPLSTGDLTRLGIATPPDATNRLAVASDASLFNHAGAGHQMKLNKAASTNTASLLFQSNWSGRAEIGLLGTDLLQFKTSSDGSTWAVGLTIDGRGIVRLPTRPLVSATLHQNIITPASASAIGFDTLTANQGGFTLGSALSSGYGKGLVVPAGGFYRIALHAMLQASTAFSLECQINGTAIALSLASQASTSPLQTWQASGIFELSAGDVISLKTTGTMSLTTGEGKTVLSACLL